VLDRMHRLLRESAQPADHSSVRPMSDPVRGVRLRPPAASTRPTLGTVALAR
jgi:hypothetical protein